MIKSDSFTKKSWPALAFIWQKCLPFKMEKMRKKIFLFFKVNKWTKKI